MFEVEKEDMISNLYITDKAIDTVWSSQTGIGGMLELEGIILVKGFNRLTWFEGLKIIETLDYMSANVPKGYRKQLTTLRNSIVTSFGVDMQDEVGFRAY